MTKCQLLNGCEVDINFPILYNFSGGDINVFEDQKNNKSNRVAISEFCCAAVQQEKHDVFCRSQGNFGAVFSQARWKIMV